MVRILAEGVVLFAVPFVLYAGVLLLQQRYLFTSESWSKHSLLWLALAGTVLCLIAIAGTALFRTEETGVYVPAVVRDGKLVPGQFK
jgi:Family of unknown function (DUF6111)